MARLRTDGFAYFLIGDMIASYIEHSLNDSNSHCYCNFLLFFRCEGHIQTRRWKEQVPMIISAWALSTMFLSLQIGFSLGNDVDVCADLARISILECGCGIQQNMET